MNGTNAHHSYMRPRYVPVHLAPESIREDGDAGYAVYEKRVSTPSGRVEIREDWVPIRTGAANPINRGL
jgi:hypothetical protein